MTMYANKSQLLSWVQEYIKVNHSINKQKWLYMTSLLTLTIGASFLGDFSFSLSASFLSFNLGVESLSKKELDRLERLDPPSPAPSPSPSLRSLGEALGDLPSRFSLSLDSRRVGLVFDRSDMKINVKKYISGKKDKYHYIQNIDSPSIVPHIKSFFWLFI